MALFGSVMLAGMSLYFVAQEIGADFFCQGGRVMVTDGCFGGSVSFMMESLLSFFCSSAAASVVAAFA